MSTVSFLHPGPFLPPPPSLPRRHVLPSSDGALWALPCRPPGCLTVPHLYPRTRLRSRHSGLSEASPAHHPWAFSLEKWQLHPPEPPAKTLGVLSRNPSPKHPPTPQGGASLSPEHLLDPRASFHPSGHCSGPSCHWLLPGCPTQSPHQDPCFHSNLRRGSGVIVRNK